MAETKQGKIVELPEYLTVRELAELIEASPIEVIKLLMSNGVMASINQQIDYDTAAIVAAELGFEPQSITPIRVEEDAAADTSSAWRQVITEEDISTLVRRPPVITILGHVDHGKTSLLDRIRSANVTAGEAGGITQHIGAYQVEHNGRIITFLDTPGHEAFTAMRARGAQGADIAVLVVAADDGVMPQTREAIAHAKAAGVPIIVALNKVDKSNANPDRVKRQLADNDLTPDEWGGETMVLPVSALTGDGIEDLLEAISLIADDADIEANPDGKIVGTVLEAQVEKSRGVMATLLVQNGTLHRGDVVIAGNSYGRIKAMFDYTGEPIERAYPSTPARVMGLNEVPEAGTMFEVVKNEKIARVVLEERQQARSASSGQVRPAFTLEELFARYQAGEAKELLLILKVDVQGSLEPISNGLNDIKVQENEADLKVRILHSDVGNVTESDVMLASASKAFIVGFNVDVDNAAQRKATSEGVDIRLYSIIYELFEEIEAALMGMLEPVYEDKVIGEAEVRQVFHIKKVGTVAGSYIREGEARRDATARVVRNNKEIYMGRVTGLKRFEDDVREVRTGFECGISVSGFTDFKEGDVIRFVVQERVR